MRGQVEYMQIIFFCWKILVLNIVLNILAVPQLDTLSTNLVKVSL